MKRFDFVLTFILTYVTCGIYTMYVWTVMGNGHNRMADENGTPRIMNFWLNVLLTLVTCGIFNFFWMYNFMKQQNELLEAKGLKAAPTDNPILLMLLMFVPVYSWYVLCDNHNKLVDAQ